MTCCRTSPTNSRQSTTSGILRSHSGMTMTMAELMHHAFCYIFGTDLVPTGIYILLYFKSFFAHGVPTGAHQEDLAGDRRAS
jgi:hypothetical protein